MENQNLQDTDVKEKETVSLKKSDSSNQNFDSSSSVHKKQSYLDYGKQYLCFLAFFAIIIFVLKPKSYTLENYIAAVLATSVVFFLLYVIGDNLPDTPSDTAEKEKTNTKKKKKSKIEIMEEQYFEHLNSIPKFEISISDEEIKRTALKNLEPIKHTNITKKTSSDKYFRFIAIDIETTGLSAFSEIIEVSAIKFVDFEPVEVFTTLCKSRKSISEEITEINHITNEMVADKPYFYQIVPSLRDFIGDFPLVGHNIDFDLKFLRMYGLDITISKRLFFDTVEMSQKKLKRIKKDPDGYLHYDKDYDVIDYKLGTIRNFFGIYQPKKAEHRSLSDAYTTALIFKELIDLIKN